MSATHFFIKNIIENHFGLQKISVIDYGCGSGELLNYLEKRKIEKYCGFDVGGDCLRVAKEVFLNKKYLFKRINKRRPPWLGKNNSIDLIVLIGVLQYMTSEEVDHLLKESKRVLTKNGIIIISCAIDHYLYKIFNLYRFFIPNHYIDRKKLISKLKEFDFIIDIEKEKGLIVAPLFSNIFSLFFDAFDRVIFKTRGTIGPVGLIARKLADLLIKQEYKLPIDYGYTLFIKGKLK